MTRHYIKPGTSSEERNRQHENRWASLVQDPDGSWRLSAYFDADNAPERVRLGLELQGALRWRARETVAGVV